MEGETQCNILGSFALPMPIQQPYMSHSNQLALLIVRLLLGHCASCRLAELYARWFYEDSARTRPRLRVRMGNLPGQRRRAV